MKIAVVEDERSLAEAIQEGLTDDGYEVHLYHDGQAGYDAVSTDITYDAVILDLILPKITGFEVARKLRADRNPVPIIVLTARDTTEDKIEALDNGADDFVTKPFTFGELTARLRAISRRPKELVPDTYEVADLVIRPTIYEVKRADERIFLTNKEFELLLLLLQNRGQVKTRDEIYKHLWHGKSERVGNVVDVHVRNLRKKLHDDDQKIIQTMRGVGYAIL